MIDWLYGELDESKEAPFDDHLASCARCRAEVESLRETRDAMRELPEVEPPPAVSAILLHEAAKRAPAPARARASVAVESERGAGILDWLAGFFRPVLQHPAATAVATLVLVAGVAGSLYLRGEHKVSEPMLASEDRAEAREGGLEVESTPPASSITAEPAEPLGRGKLSDGRFDQSRQYEVTLADEGDSDFFDRLESSQKEGLDEGLARKADAPTEGVSKRTEAAAEQEKSGKRTARLREHRSKTPAGAAGSSTASPPLDFTANAVSGADPLVDFEEDNFAQPPPAFANDDKQVLRQSSTGEVVGGAIESTADKPAERPVDAKPAPAKASNKRKSKAPAQTRGLAKDAPSRDSRNRPTVEVAPNAPAPDPASTPTYRVYRDPKKELQWAKTEARKLSKALSSQRCRDAAKIANDILDRNPDYYYDKVAGTKSIKRCQWYVNNEQERRARQRTKARAQRRPSPKKTTGQAARQADEAVAEPAAE